jgi:hypothetical protein
MARKTQGHEKLVEDTFSDNKQHDTRAVNMIRRGRISVCMNFLYELRINVRFSLGFIVGAGVLEVYWRCISAVLVLPD